MNWTKWGKRWWRHSQKADTQSFEPRVQCHEECSKAKVVESCRSTIVPTRKGLQLFFEQLLLWISSVFTEQSQKCVKNMNLIMTERRNQLWEDSRVLRLCQVWSRQNVLLNNDDPSQKEFLLQRYGERMEKFITTRQIEQILYWCRIPDYCWSRTVFHDERHWRIFTIHKFSGSSWVHFAKRRRYIWTKGLDQREHQNIGSYWKLQSVACKVIMEVRSELSLWTTTILTRGSEFLTTCFPQDKYGVEIRIQSENKDNSHSWVRISHGLNKLVTNLNNKEQETSEIRFEEYR